MLNRALRTLLTVPVVIAAACPAASAETLTTVVVRAAAFPGAVSGVFVTPARPAVVAAAGTWSVGGPYGSFGPRGSEAFGTESCARVTSVPMGALVGSLDNGSTWFPIGTGPTTVTGFGALILAANDCPGPGGSFYSDNSGAMSVTITDAPPAAGSVLAWGTNQDGQSGPVGTGRNLGLPPQSVGLTDVIAVTGGCCQSYALQANGTVWGWGANFGGQLGDRDPGPRPVPIITGAIAIAAGSYHALALKPDGTVWGWGVNFYGELGRRADALNPAYPGPSYPTPLRVVGIDHIVAIAAGNFTSFALRDDGTVWGWGYNHDGEVGLGNPQGPDPHPIAGLTDIVAISAVYSHGLALRNDGAVWGWGDNTLGQLGAPPSGPSAPVEIVKGMVGVAAGTQHSLALAADGSVWAWGYNLGQRIGPAPEGPMLPHQVLGAVGTIALAAGASQSLALTRDGTVWKWGDNDGVPRPVPGLLHASAVTGGWVHSVAVLSPPIVSSIELAAATGNTTESAIPLVLTRAGTPVAGRAVRVVVDLARAATVVSDSNGRATASFAGLSQGIHSVLAIFEGDTETSSSVAEAALEVSARLPPILTWPTPVPIVYGTALSSAQLNASASIDGLAVAGAFTYSPAEETMLRAGAGQVLSVTFTPADSSRYKPVTATTTLTVERAPLSVTAASFTRVAGETLPEFTVTFDGFVLGDGPSVLASPVVVTTTASAGSPVGTYPITPSGASAADYAIAFRTGTLTITNNICAAYDQATPKKSGSTVPIKLRLCDVNGANLSSPALTVTTERITLVSGAAEGSAEDAGNANPDGDFRYDPTLAGYIFNLQTKGLSVGTYAISFRVSGDSNVHSLRFSVK